jgi:enoyl-[acyl-carrier-protein] reductase (NADH)
VQYLASDLGQKNIRVNPSALLRLGMESSVAAIVLSR